MRNGLEITFNSKADFERGETKQTSKDDKPHSVLTQAAKVKN